MGAFAVMSGFGSRDESLVGMAGKHDRRTFRGKVHAGSYGKCRKRGHQKRKEWMMKQGTWEEPEPRPEPEHCWDVPNILNNPMYYFPDYLREAFENRHEDYVEAMREDGVWQERWRKKGPQGAYKGWTPPGMEPLDDEPTPGGPFGGRPSEGPPPSGLGTAENRPAKEEKPLPKPAFTPEPEEAKEPEPVPEIEEPADAPEKPKPEEPAKEEAPPPPPAEEPKPEPAKEEAPPPPPAEEAKPEPAKEEAPPPPPAEEAKAEPAKEEAPPPPPAEEAKAEPVVEAAPEPKAEAKPEPVAEAKPAGGKISAKAVKELRTRSMAGILDCQKALKEADGDMDKAMDWLKKKGVAKADKKAGNIAAEGNIASYVHFNQKIGVIVEVNSETDFVASNAIFREFTKDVAMQIAANPTVVCVTADDVPAEVKEKATETEMAKEDLAGKPDNIKEKIVAGRVKKQFEEMALLGQKWLKDEDKTVEDILKERIAKLGENLVIRRFERLSLGEGLEKKDDDFAAGVEKELAKYRADPNAAPEEKKEEAPKEEKPKEEAPKEEKKETVQVSAAQVKELRGRSGAGILDSKKALAESGGDMDKAMEWLKKKGMAKADKKVGNLSAEGAIASYVHFNQKIGVLVEINSETDFVAINAIFKEFTADVAMQIAANPTVMCVSTDEVPADVVAKEKAIEMEKEDLAGKPDAIKEKIVEGRLKKKYEELALLNQKWLKDEDKTVLDVLKERIAKLGENIVIRRFVRLNLGEGLEKRDDDFAAGVEKELAKYRS